jgi:flagellin
MSPVRGQLHKATNTLGKDLIMANDVVLGAALRSNLLSLQNTQRNIDVTQLRLATGKKVNSALDNPQSFFQAQSLNNRASDLTRLLDGIGQSIRTIEEADKGITALTSLIEQASSVADEAQSEIRAAQGFASITGTKDLRGLDLTVDSGGAIANNDVFAITIKDDDINSGTAVTANITIATSDTVYDLAAKINDSVAIANANFSDNVRASVDAQGRLKIESLEEGAVLRISDQASGANSLGADGYTFLGLDNLVSTENVAATTGQGGTAVAGRTLFSTASAGTAVNGKYQASDTLVTAGYITAADDIDIRLVIDGESVDIGQFTDTATIQDVIDGINNSGSDKVSANFNVDTGQIEVEFADNVGTVELEIESNAASVVDFGFGTGAADNAVASTAADVNSESFRLVGSSANLAQYTTDFNKLRSQIDGIVEDANYRGVNLLGGDNLTTFFNEDRSNSLVTTGADLTVDGLGIAEADFIDAASIEQSINEVRNALEAVRNFGSSIANDLSIIQTRQDFTEQTINTLKAGAGDLTDADLNEEGANLLALQTAQQLGVTSLSLASQSQQSVLRLF